MGCTNVAYSDLEEHYQNRREDTDHKHPCHCLRVVVVHLLDNSRRSHWCYQQHQRM